MRVRRQVTLDAQFGKDIVWLRDEFRPSIMGTRDKVFVPVTVIAPDVDAAGQTKQCEVTLLIYADDLYVLGWRNSHGEFLLSDHPDAPNPNSLKFASHYGRDLGAFVGGPMTAPLICRAVKTLGNVKDIGVANRMQSQVALMALTVSESLRQDVVAGLMESLFAYRREGGTLDRDLIRHYANNYNKNIKNNDPYVELPLHH